MPSAPSIQEKARQRCHWLPDLSHHQGPRYQGIVDALAQSITQGTLTPGVRLPPQRLMADALGVTVGTITRAYREAERRGLVETKVGSGTRIKEASSESDKPSFSHLSQAAADSIDLSLSVQTPHPGRHTLWTSLIHEFGDQAHSSTLALDYQTEQGAQAHRQQLADWLNQQALNVDAHELILTTGGQHADYLALQALVRPGEAVASAALTYPGMIAASRQLGFKHIAVPMDAEGIQPEALERLCQQQRIRMLYVMPEHNNPTGAHMSEARRQAIVDVARRHDMLLLEDGVQFVSAAYRGRPFFELAPERSLYLFSISKLLSGGLRFGALRAPTALISRLTAALRAQCWSLPGIVPSLALAWLTSPQGNAIIDWQWQEVSARHQLLDQYLAGYTLSTHPCSFHAWLKLPEPWRAHEFVQQAAAVGVTLINPDPFCVGSQPAPQSVRICLTPPEQRDRLALGLERLARLLHAGPPLRMPLV